MVYIHNCTQYILTHIVSCVCIVFFLGAFQFVFQIPGTLSIVISVIPPVFYMFVCFVAKPNLQISIAAIMSVLYAFLMTASFFSIIGEAHPLADWLAFGGTYRATTVPQLQSISKSKGSLRKNTYLSQAKALQQQPGFNSSPHTLQSPHALSWKGPVSLLLSLSLISRNAPNGAKVYIYI